MSDDDDKKLGCMPHELRVYGLALGTGAAISLLVVAAQGYNEHSRAISFLVLAALFVVATILILINRT